VDFFFFFHLLGTANSDGVFFGILLAVVSKRTVCQIRWSWAQACKWPVVCLVRVVRVYSHLRRWGHIPRKTLQ